MVSEALLLASEALLLVAEAFLLDSFRDFTPFTEAFLLEAEGGFPQKRFSWRRRLSSLSRWIFSLRRKLEAFLLIRLRYFS